jgi:hypothetical protein
VRQAACALQSVTQPIPAPSSPESRLPHGGSGIFTAAS